MARFAHMGTRGSKRGGAVYRRGAVRVGPRRPQPAPYVRTRQANLGLTRWLKLLWPRTLPLNKRVAERRGRVLRT